MGLLINGEWQIQDVNPKTKDGGFHRLDSVFRHVISSKSDIFIPEPNRYHLYVSYACPWAHRVLIMRALKGLESVISVNVVHPFMGEDGWSFETCPGATGDTVNGFAFLKECYVKANPMYSGRVTVPVLWDTHTDQIVNNESIEILHQFNDAFHPLGLHKDNYYPHDYAKEIDALYTIIYNKINNGVYRVGFAHTQQAYDEALVNLYDGLDMMEGHLKDRDYLVGDQLTLIDICLYVTLVRFDFCYVVHFKCNKKMICQYPNLYRYLKMLHKQPAFSSTTHLSHCKEHYFGSHLNLNPLGIVAAGPDEALYFQTV